MRISAVFLVASSFAFGQLSSNSITIVARRTIDIQPDQAVFSIHMTSGLSTGLADVTGALQGSGITAVNLSGVTTQTLQLNQNLPQQNLRWSFLLAVPFSQIQTTFSGLLNIQQTIAKSNVAKDSNGLALEFSLASIRASDRLVASQTCPISALMSDAQAQAQKVAAAAGFSVGPVQASSSTGVRNGTNNVAALALVGFPQLGNSGLQLGNIFSGVPGIQQLENIVLQLIPFSPTECSIVVKFGLRSL